jgi:hypothetical protein
MNEMTNAGESAPVEPALPLLELGKWMGRRDAFGQVAGRCSAAEIVDPSSDPRWQTVSEIELHAGGILRATPAGKRANGGTRTRQPAPFRPRVFYRPSIGADQRA